MEKRLSVTYMPFNLVDSGPVIGRDDHLEKKKFPFGLFGWCWFGWESVAEPKSFLVQ